MVVGQVLHVGINLPDKAIWRAALRAGQLSVRETILVDPGRVSTDLAWGELCPRDERIAWLLSIPQLNEYVLVAWLLEILKGLDHASRLV